MAVADETPPTAGRTRFSSSRGGVTAAGRPVGHKPRRGHHAVPALTPQRSGTGNRQRKLETLPTRGVGETTDENNPRVEGEIPRSMQNYFELNEMTHNLQSMWAAGKAELGGKTVALSAPVGRQSPGGYPAFPLRETGKVRAN